MCIRDRLLTVSLIPVHVDVKNDRIPFQIVSVVLRITAHTAEIFDRIAVKTASARFFIAFHKVSVKARIAFQIRVHWFFTALSFAPINETIAVSTVISNDFIAFQTDEKNVFIPVHAFFQLPVNTPVRKSIRPPRASRRYPMIWLVHVQKS